MPKTFTIQITCSLYMTKEDSLFLRYRNFGKILFEVSCIISTFLLNTVYTLAFRFKVCVLCSFHGIIVFHILLLNCGLVFCLHLLPLHVFLEFIFMQVIDSLFF